MSDVIGIHDHDVHQLAMSSHNYPRGIKLLIGCSNAVSVLIETTPAPYSSASKLSIRTLRPVETLDRPAVAALKL